LSEQGNRISAIGVEHRQGQHSIRFNDPWRLCFRCHDGFAHEVAITHHHCEATMNSHSIRPISPGEILYAEFMRPLAISSNALARSLDVPANRIRAIVNGKRTITADTALRLSRYFGTGAQLWLNLQTDYDLRVVRRQQVASI
jgi:addiction module HigA family antidote